MAVSEHDAALRRQEEQARRAAPGAGRAGAAEAPTPAGSMLRALHADAAALRREVMSLRVAQSESQRQLREDRAGRERLKETVALLVETVQRMAWQGPHAEPVEQQAQPPPMKQTQPEAQPQPKRPRTEMAHGKEQEFPFAEALQGQVLRRANSEGVPVPAHVRVTRGAAGGGDGNASGVEVASPLTV